MEFVKNPTIGCWPAVDSRRRRLSGASWHCRDMPSLVQPPYLRSHRRANSGKVDSSVRIRVHFYSYCKDLTGCASVSECIGPASRIEDLLQQLFVRFPRLAPAQKSLLVAVGVDYQGSDYVLQEGDEVSLFPPVQGG